MLVAIRRSRVFVCLLVLAVLGGSASPVAAGWLDDEIADIISKVNDTRSKVNEMVANVREGVKDLTGNARRVIDEVVEQAQRRIEEERAALDAFLNDFGECEAPSQCFDFREDLLTLLTTIEDLSNTLAENAPVPVDVNLDSIKSVVAELPGGLLYPLYLGLALGTNVLESDFVDSLADAVEDIHVLQEVLDDNVADVCADVILPAGPDRFKRAALGAKIAAIGMNKLGTKLTSNGENAKEATVGIHGYVLVTFRFAWLKRLGTFFDGASQSLNWTADYVQKETLACVSQTQQAEILARQQSILENQEAILSGQAEILEAVRDNRPPWGKGAQGKGR